MGNVIHQVTVARTIAATLSEAFSVLQRRVADQTAALRQSRPDLHKELERRT